MNEETRRFMIGHCFRMTLLRKEAVEDTLDKLVTMKIRYERETEEYIKAVLDFKEQLKEAKEEGILTDEEYDTMYDRVLIEVKE